MEWGGIVGGVLGLTGDALNAYYRREGAEMQNQWNRELAEDQRQWNLEMWNRQNAYNHPQEQMARLSQAGLNPRLIYNTGASSAVGTASDVKGYDRAEARNVMEGFDAFSNIVQHIQMGAQTDNIKAQTDVAKQEAALKSLGTLEKAVDIDQKKFNYGLSKDLRNFSVDAARANSEKAISEARRSEIEQDVSYATKDPRIKKVREELSILQQQLKNTKEANRGQVLENKLKEIEYSMRKAGVTFNDNMFFRIIGQDPDFQYLKDLIFNRSFLKP